MGFFSGGKSESRSDAFSGLRGTDMSGYNALLARTPGDVNFLTNRLQAQVDQNPFTLNSQGFLPEQMAGVNMLGKNMFADVASNYAGRGLTNPQNISGVVGSALASASPQLMGMIQQNVFGNETAKQNRFQMLQNAMNLYPSLLGQESHTTQKTTAPGIGFTFANSLASSLGNTIGSLGKGGEGGAGSGGGGGQGGSGGGKASAAKPLMF